MKFLTVGNMYPPHHLGGYELIWQSAVEHLRRQDHEVRVLTTDHRERQRSDGGEPDVYRELAWYWKDHRFPSMSWRQRLNLERRNAAVFSRHLEELEPDALGWWAMGGMSLSLIERVRRLGLPAAGFVCDDWMLYGTRTDAWLRTFGRPGLAPLAERITDVPTRVNLSATGTWVFMSEAVRRPALERWGLAKTAVVKRGIDHDLFKPAPRPEWGWRLLYVGRLDPRKGVDLAIRSLNELPAEATMTIAGGGDDEYLRELERIVRQEQLEDRVRFLAHVAGQDLPGLYASADTVVFPVLWAEPWGLVPLEAMAVGVPVVATGRGGSGEYLRDGENCVIFDPDGGPGALAAALRRIAASQQLRSDLRDQGFLTTRSFKDADFDIAVEEHMIAAVSEGENAP